MVVENFCACMVIIINKIGANTNPPPMIVSEHILENPYLILFYSWLNFKY